MHYYDDTSRAREISRKEVFHAFVDSALPGLIAFVVILAFQGPKMAGAQGLVIFIATFAVKLLWLKYVAPSRPRQSAGRYATYRGQSQQSYPHTRTQQPVRQPSYGHQQLPPVITPAYTQLQGSPTAGSLLAANPDAAQQWTRAGDGSGYVPLGPDGRPQYERRRQQLPRGAILM